MKNHYLPVSGQLVSEQELVGAFIFKKYKRKQKDQKIIKFFRFDVDGYLNNFQSSILYFLNYKHVTYEWHYDLRKTQSYKHLIKCIVRDLFISDNSDYIRFNNSINVLHKFLVKLKN